MKAQLLGDQTRLYFGHALEMNMTDNALKSQRTLDTIGPCCLIIAY